MQQKPLGVFDKPPGTIPLFFRNKETYGTRDLHGEDSIAGLCRREGINCNMNYHWSNEFLEAGKNTLSGDTTRETTSDQANQSRTAATALKDTLSVSATR